MPFCCAHFSGWRNSGDSHQQTSTKVLSFLWFALLFLPSVADGYLVGRLLSLQNVADAHRQLLEATTTGDRRALMQPPLVLMMPSPNGDGLEDLAENKRAGDFVPKKGVNVEEIGGDGSSDYSNQEQISYAKKSLGLSASNGYMALNKFNGSGSRNCFFTPIQCMIQHDMGKYKKLVDSDIRLQLSG